MKASHQGDDGVVRSLIAAGARLDARNADGDNALWLDGFSALDMAATVECLTLVRQASRKRAALVGAAG